MAKRGRHRPRQPQRAATGNRPRHDHRAAREPDLLADVGRALRDPDPLALLALVSTLLLVVDPRGEDPFARARDTETPRLSRDELVASFLDIQQHETSALLAVIGELADDELLRARIKRELLLRVHTMPAWLTRLGEVKVYRVIEMVHVLGDGDNVYLGLRWPTGEELSVVVYIDHNMGTLVKDAFVVPEPISVLVDTMRRLVGDDPDTEWRDLGAADARARVADAVATAAITYPPFETDTWPACRAIVEWAVGLLPQGGHGYERPEWSEADQAALTERFYASPFGRVVDDADYRSLITALLWFGTDYGPGDPMRWSPVAVEIVMLDWVPRKIITDADSLAKLPELMRAFVAFCHRERGIRTELTVETIAAIDEYEPEYQRIIRSPRPQGPAALLARMGMLEPDEWDEPDEPDFEPWDDSQWYDVMLDGLREAVGDDATLRHLDAAPLPDEPFAWEGIAGDVHARVAEVLARCDACCDELLDVEYRTACRRFLAVIARADPSIFRRKARADTAAAAVCWVMGKANGLFSSWSGGGRMYVKDLLGHFGLKDGSVSTRAATMLRAAGVADRTFGEIRLGTPDYLVSSRRARIIELRDHYQSMRTS